MAHLIVLGNEKGGSGKSTTAMHLTTALLRSGHRVAVIDLDLRQQSLGRYIDNRAGYITRTGHLLHMPRKYALVPSKLDSAAAAHAEEEKNFARALRTLFSDNDFIVIDCPGTHSRYSEMAHSAADTLITPMNDSLVDFDLLARVDPENNHIQGPSIYAEGVWQARKVRAAAGLKPLDWVVMRNRMSTLEARNKRRLADALAELGPRIGFRIVPGFSERVIFRELFLNGLTLLDLPETDPASLTLSNIAARQEVRNLVKALNLPGVVPAF
ncbi:MAG: division plane positioning ATPase MipZ [Paracoccaceae bacterium]